MFTVNETVFSVQLWIGHIEYDKYTWSRGKTTHSEEYGPFNTENEAKDTQKKLEKLYKNKTNVGGEVEVEILEKEANFFEADDIKSLYEIIENLWSQAQKDEEELRKTIEEMKAELAKKTQELKRHHPDYK